MTNLTYVDSMLQFLRRLLKNSSFSSDMKDRYHKLLHELEYLKLYLLCMAKWNDSSFSKDKNFGFVEESQMEDTLLKAYGICLISRWDLASELPEKIQQCRDFTSELLEKIQQCKPKIKEDCLNFLDCPFQREFSSAELPEFIRCVSATFHKLPHLKADIIPDVKMKIRSLEGNLDLFKEVLEFAAKRCSSPEDLKDFKIRIQAWACGAACLPLLYWVLDVKKEDMAPRMDVILSDLQSIISPSTPEVTRMYLAVLKASKPSAKDGLTVGKLIMKFVEFLKDNLQVHPEKDDIQMLFIELIFLTTFLMDRPEAKMLAEGEFILTQADAVVNEVASLISSLSSGEINKGSDKEWNFLLQNILAKANAIKAEVRRIYAHLFFYPSSFNFPTINILEFIDSLMENLKDFCFHFPKGQLIMMLQQELLSLKESNLKDFSILELQNKHTDIKDLWIQIVNVAYNAERAVCSFIYIEKSLWHDILCLSDVIEEVKHIRGKVKRIQDQHIYDIHAVNSEMSPNPLLPSQVSLPIMDEVVVGFQVEVEEILVRILGGSPKLDIISIVGMPGLGKTTLAKKVYRYASASVQNHFDKCAWCAVSQTFNSKRMLLDIVSGLDVCDRNDLSTMDEEDLAQRVYRSLRGQRYLIVLDDIWDVSAWNALKMSFPDDNNQSRILFTSRIHKVALEAKSSCSPFPVNPLSGEESWQLLPKPLSEEESWQLLEQKLFDQDGCPLNFVEIGRQIATSCKGLPLAIVLIAGLLKEKIGSLRWWKKIGERLDSLIAEEVCMDTLELSYKHLPEFLKPCFLYFGSFREDEEIRVNKLIQLWISDGFIQKDKIKSLEVVAKEYLMDLVGRSLVIVTKRSSTGGIKACTIHDVLHDFCLAKGEEAKVFKVIEGNEVSHMATSCPHYRVCIQTECWASFLEHGFTAPFVHSLLPFGRNSHHSVGGLKPIHIRYLASQFKFLQVLNLISYCMFDGFPEEITELVLLRYFAMLCDYEYIPAVIKRLENLETLSLREDPLLQSLIWRERKIPLTLWEMQKLRHVDLQPVCIPFDLCDDISPLENVLTFSSLVADYDQEQEVEMFLRSIPKVQKLRCGFRGRISHPVFKFDFLSQLESLSLTDYNFSSNSILQGCAFHFPPTLKKLSLRDFKLPWSEISAISKLPSLEVLKLHDAFYGDTWNVEDEQFLKLKFLKLSSLDIKQLNASDDSFPCLESFVVDFCRELAVMPSGFGSISTLKMIQLKNCYRSTLLSSASQIQKEQVDIGNEHLEVLVSGAMYWTLSDSDSDSDS